ncbi:PREDICTED: baculoviral IAP repeat-containing protein 7 [Elephantulus edwardii]|uniref:baculoviral IAP repeat-containing protein 7 n=1 Tax=Elephantulus edwardii TaxID=28737 RepID=UPI0003F0A3E7|nr:PREDICTED: baculoviral IAP repeat-containing protein 7 [Elephantulus edwardii]
MIIGQTTTRGLRPGWDPAGRRAVSGSLLSPPPGAPETNVKVNQVLATTDGRTWRRPGRRAQVPSPRERGCPPRAASVWRLGPSSAACPAPTAAAGPGESNRRLSSNMRGARDSLDSETIQAEELGPPHLRQQQAPLLPCLGPLVGRLLGPALLPEGAEAISVHRPRAGSPLESRLDMPQGQLRLGAFPMGPEEKGRCCHHSLELSLPRSRWCWDSVDGQILGQLHTLYDEEEEEEEEEEGVEGAEATLGPAFPRMGSEELRLASFHDWPVSSSICPMQLAEAGFFHTGPQDKVRCFFCSGGLQRWEPGDDPWTEHAKWFPRCEFLLQSKGRDFVQSIQASCLLESWDPLEEPGEAAIDVPERATSTEEQLQRLQQERTCKVCLDRTVGVVFAPCGHLVCTECAPNLRVCPICRAPISSCIRTFLS